MTEPESGAQTFAVFLTPVRAGMPDDPTPAETEAVGAHLAYYERLLDDGDLVLAGRTTASPIWGVMVFEAGSLEEAERVARADPGVVAGVFEVRVQPFRVVLMRG